MTWTELVDTYGKYEVYFKGGYKHKFKYESDPDDASGVYLQVVFGDGDPQTVYGNIPEYSFLEHLNVPLEVKINS